MMGTVSHTGDRASPTSVESAPALGAVVLTSLAALFLVRVFAQFIQWTAPTVLLPPFEAWQSSGLPYPLLLAVQIVILAAMVWAIRRRHVGLAVFASWLAGPARWFAVAYLTVMLARLVAGLTLLPDVGWFARTLPAFFHLVLASFLLVALAGDRRLAGRAGEPSRWRALARVSSWPGVMALAIATHLLLARAGVAAGLSAVLAIALGAGLAILHEFVWPYRRGWRPSAGDVRTDLVYLAVVQVLVPRLLGLAAIWVIVATPADVPSVASPWPHEWHPVRRPC